MSRVWHTLTYCVLLLLTGCGGADTETLWREVDSAIENADCEAARPSLDVLIANEESLDEDNRTKLSSLDQACGSLARATKKLNVDQALAALYYERALESLEPQTPLYHDIAARVIELYDTTPLDSLLDNCSGNKNHYAYHVFFYEASLINEETYIQAELMCTELIVDRIEGGNGMLIDAPKFGEAFDAQMAALELLFSEDEFATLKVEYEQRLMAALRAYLPKNTSNTTRTKRWLEEAEFLDASIRDDFFPQVTYQNALLMYEDAVEADLGYGDAVDALQAFIDDYPYHPLVEEVGTMLTEANAGLERVGINDDGKIAMFYQNGTPHKVSISFQWNHSDGFFLDKETLELPPCEACTETSGCIASSPIEEIRLVPQDYVYSLFIAHSSVLPSGGPVTIDTPGFVCISLTSDWMSQSGLFD